mmetsp:Transcript_27488/g.49744  ORF Transcript_27488/g.49744 Transcript_27488/m.49744 type:complete len:136 (+) Transcript_27488:96-503(+)
MAVEKHTSMSLTHPHWMRRQRYSRAELPNGLLFKSTLSTPSGDPSEDPPELIPEAWGVSRLLGELALAFCASKRVLSVWDLCKEGPAEGPEASTAGLSPSPAGISSLSEAFGSWSRLLSLSGYPGGLAGPVLLSL